MRFSESGLPKHPLIEKAFNYGKGMALSKESEGIKEFNKQITVLHTRQMKQLEMAKKAGQISDEIYDAKKKDLEKQYAERLKIGPIVVSQGLNEMFEVKSVGPARALVKYADNPSPELIAASMLYDGVRSAKDFQGVVKEFGESVGKIVADINHIEVYPSERPENLAKSSPEARRAFFAIIIATLEEMNKQAQETKKESDAQKKKNPDAPDVVVKLPAGEEQKIFDDAKAASGDDAKMDAQFITLFNSLTAAANSPFKVERDSKGKIELVKDDSGAPPVQPKGPKKPNGPKNPPNNGSLGDDVF